MGIFRKHQHFSSDSFTREKERFHVYTKQRILFNCENHCGNSQQSRPPAPPNIFTSSFYSELQSGLDNNFVFNYRYQCFKTLRSFRLVEIWCERGLKWFWKLNYKARHKLVVGRFQSANFFSSLDIQSIKYTIYNNVSRCWFKVAWDIQIL